MILVKSTSGKYWAATSGKKEREEQGETVVCKKRHIVRGKGKNENEKGTYVSTVVMNI